MSIDIPTHKVFISYHHANDQDYKDDLIRRFDDYLFIDDSVYSGDIDENLSDEKIREKIRDEYLRNTSVTIVLVGTETKGRKHVDWEIYSSMYDGAKNKKSGILVVNLPTISQPVVATDDDEKRIISDMGNWIETVNYDDYLPYMPRRILDNLNSEVPISVINYSRIIENPLGFKKLIDIAYSRRTSNDYNLSRPMKRQDE